tara:strand:- start:400 stop:933 length:534 start_codon:yes stop_codon:yes gene_type:complete
MKKLFLTVFFVIFSFPLLAQEEGDIKVNLNGFKDSMDLYSSESFNQEVKEAFKFIEKKENINDYEKYLMKEKVLMIYKMIFMADKPKESQQALAKDFMLLATCISYHLKYESDKYMRELISFVLDGDDKKIEKYSVMGKKIYSEDFLKLLKEYIGKMGKDVNTVCNEPLNMKNINEY